MSHREQILDAARDAVMRARNNTYGPPTQDFDRTAGVLNALGLRINGEPLQPHHVAMVQIAVKLSRITWSPTHMDSWVDIAGYAACGYECAVANADLGRDECPECAAQEGHAFSCTVYDR